MKTLVFCLEEPSAKEMLKGVLPRILPDDVTARFIIFKGKQESKKYRTPDHLANPVQELRLPT